MCMQWHSQTQYVGREQSGPVDCCNGTFDWSTGVYNLGGRAQQTFGWAWAPPGPPG